MKQSLCIFVFLILGCASTSESVFDEIMNETDFYINFEETNALALSEGMDVNAALARISKAGFNEKRLMFRARSNGLAYIHYLQKTRGQPPRKPTLEECEGLYNRYSHRYYRNESVGNDVIFSVIQLSQGGMIVDMDCENAVTKISPVKTYKIKNATNQ